jgi:predicted nucleotidyltransferase
MTDHGMEEKIVRFFEARPEVAAVYLFGSTARGKAKETSDVDVAILIDPDAKIDAFELNRDLMGGLSRVLRKEVHLVVLNRAGERLYFSGFDGKDGGRSRFQKRNGSCVRKA